MQASDEDARATFEQALNGPIGVEARARRAQEPQAPAWWHGDEEASQSSMAAIAAVAAMRRGG